MSSKMQSEVYISLALVEHAHALALIEATCFSDAWSESSMNSHLMSSYTMTVIAKDENDEIIGYISGSTCPPECEIFRVATLPEHRRVGIGRKMLSEYVRLATERGCEDFFIEVRETNVAARALYSSFGFCEVGKRKGYYTSPREDAILLSAHFCANDENKQQKA